MTKIGELVSKAKEFGVPALAITDHRNTSGHVKFYKECQKQGIKPLLGCCLPGQLIYTYDGIKPIEEVKVGDLVLTHKGQFKPVLATMVRPYEGTIYGVDAWYANTVWLTPEHPVLTASVRDGGVEYSWTRADELTPSRCSACRRIEPWNTFVVFPKLHSPFVPCSLDLASILGQPYYASNGRLYRMKVEKFGSNYDTGIPACIDVTLPLMRLLGCYIAGGSLFHDAGYEPSGVMFTFNNTTKLDRAYQTVEDLRMVFGLEVSMRKRPDQDTAVEVICSSAVVAQFFDSLCGSSAPKKKIPGFVYCCDGGLIEAFIDGLLSNATLCLRQVTLKTTSRDAVWGTRLLISKLGYIGKVQTRFSSNSKHHTVYALTWHHDSNERRVTRYLDVKDYILIPLVAVCCGHYDGLVYNLEVAEDNSYVTDIVLHNCEVNETDDRLLKSRDGRKEKGFDDYHLILLAKENRGYKNLLEIVSDAATTGLFDKTEQTDMAVLAERGSGIIATSACLAGRIPRLIMANRHDEAEIWAARFAEVFDQFYLELQPNSIPEQAAVNQALIKLARKLSLPLCVGVDTHYLTTEDAYVHEILLCIQTGKKLNDEQRLRFAGGPDYYLWSPEEIDTWARSSDIPYSAIENTLYIAEQCNVTLGLGTVKLPAFATPDGSSQEDYLVRLCHEELARRYAGTPHYQEYSDRMTMELDVICSKGFAGYFLILRDILEFCRRQGIPVGGGRGSAAGSLVAYLLRITTIDPIKNGLLFHRFLNPERPSLPDIDSDISDKRRDEVIAYVRDTYGHAAQIATYSMLHPKGAVRDICRVLDIPYKEADILAGYIPDKMPDQSEVTLEKFFLPLNDRDAAVVRWGTTDADRIANKAKAFLEASSQYPQLLPVLKRLEGVVRSVGIHAGGVLIAPSELTDYSSLIASPGKTVCSLDMDDVEDCGLLKIDLLGLRTVSVVHEASALAGVDINSIPMDDPEVYRLYQEGRTHGVFQLSGDGITRYAKQVRPVRFSDLVDILALYRPGPLDAVTETGRTIAEQYVYNREHPDEIVYSHPDLREILDSTYGVIIYQEQVMEIARRLAGYSMGRSDELRKLIGKKKVDQFPAARQAFVEGGRANGYPEALMQSLFDQIEKFGGYAFNRSHSAAYAYLSYQTAYLKAHYPVEFMCTLLSSETDSPDKTMRNVVECHRMGIPILPVDINVSSPGFKIEVLPDGTKAIRYALTAIKDIGQAVADEIVSHQPYESMSDFVKRVNGRTVHKKVMTILILAGCFDCFESNRYKLLYHYLFDIRHFKPDRVDCPDPESWGDAVRYQLDKQLFGFALTGHPAQSLPNSYWPSQPLEVPFYVSGIVTKSKTFTDKHGREMATVFVDAPFGECKLYFYAKQWSKYKSLLTSCLNQDNADSCPILSMRVKRRRFMSNDILEVISVHVPDEARRLWQEYLTKCFTVPYTRRSSPTIRLYA